jgi:hypothetical protein
MRNMLIAVAVLNVAGCTTTLSAGRTRATVNATLRQVPPLASRAIIVLSPSVLSDVATSDAAPPDAPGFAALTASMERELFDAGWDPLPRTALARMLSSHHIAVAIRDTLPRTADGLLDTATILGPASTADAILIARRWHPGWAPAPDVQAADGGLCVLVASAHVSVHDRAARLLWDAHVTVRSTDLYDIALIRRWGTEAPSDIDLACAGAGGCERCPPAPKGGVDLLAAHAATVLVRELSDRLMFVSADSKP